jgi:hypothetical protein
MKRTLAIAAVIAPLGLAPVASYAAPLAANGGYSEAVTSSVTPVQWGRCYYWRRVCADRWPWLGWRFRRCMVIHGCG